MYMQDSDGKKEWVMFFYFYRKRNIKILIAAFQVSLLKKNGSFSFREGLALVCDPVSTLQRFHVTTVVPARPTWKAEETGTKTVRVGTVSALMETPANRAEERRWKRSPSVCKSSLIRNLAGGRKSCWKQTQSKQTVVCSARTKTWNVISCVWGVQLTGYFSSGSMSRASPKMVLQYSAILACCLALWNSRCTSVRCLGKIQRREPEVIHREADVTHESTWFSKDRMRGYGEVLKALSAIASITSCRPAKKKRSFGDKNLQTFPWIAGGDLNQNMKSLYFGISSKRNTILTITFFGCFFYAQRTVF